MAYIAAENCYEELSEIDRFAVEAASIRGKLSTAE